MVTSFPSSPMLSHFEQLCCFSPQSQHKAVMQISVTSSTHHMWENCIYWQKITTHGFKYYHTQSLCLPPEFLLQGRSQPCMFSTGFIRNRWTKCTCSQAALLFRLANNIFQFGWELGNAIIKAWFAAAKEAAKFCPWQHLPGKAQVVNQSIGTNKRDVKNLKTG